MKRAEEKLENTDNSSEDPKLLDKKKSLRDGALYIPPHKRSHRSDKVWWRKKTNTHELRKAEPEVTVSKIDEEADDENNKGSKIDSGIEDNNDPSDTENVAGEDDGPSENWTVKKQKEETVATEKEEKEDKTDAKPKDQDGKVIETTSAAVDEPTIMEDEEDAPLEEWI